MRVPPAAERVDIVGAPVLIRRPPEQQLVGAIDEPFVRTQRAEGRTSPSGSSDRRRPPSRSRRPAGTPSMDHPKQKGVLVAGLQLADLVANLDVADLPSEEDPEGLVDQPGLGRPLWMRCRPRSGSGRLAVAEQTFQQAHDGGIAAKMAWFEDIISDNAGAR